MTTLNDIYGNAVSTASQKALDAFNDAMRLIRTYHGDPIAILKGRLVGLVLFGLYSSMGYVGTWMTIVILIVLAVLLPWLLGRSLRFRLHNSSYRGLRFKFHGTTKQAYWIFLAMPIFIVVMMSFNQLPSEQSKIYKWYAFTLDNWLHPCADPSMCSALKTNL